MILPALALVACTMTGSVAFGGSTWTIDTAWASGDRTSYGRVKDGVFQGGSGVNGYVTAGGVLYHFSQNGLWYERIDDSTWFSLSVGTFTPCELQPSPHRTFLTNWAEYERVAGSLGGIIDAGGNYWTVIDNPPFPEGSGITGVVMRNGERVGTGLSGCCTILATPSPPTATWAMAYCNGDVYIRRKGDGTFGRYVGGSVYADLFQTVSEATVDDACAGSTRGKIRLRIRLSVEPYWFEEPMCSPRIVFAGFAVSDRGPRHAAVCGSQGGGALNSGRGVFTADDHLRPALGNPHLSRELSGWVGELKTHLRETVAHP